MMNGKPKVAVVGNNTLALIGLRHLLQSVMPMIEVDTLGSFAELTANNPDSIAVNTFFVIVIILTCIIKIILAPGLLKIILIY